MTPAQRAALAKAVAILELAGMRPEVTRMYGARKAAAILLELELTDDELSENVPKLSIVGDATRRIDP